MSNMERADLGSWYRDGSSDKKNRREADMVIRQKSQTNIERERIEVDVAAQKKLNVLVCE